MPRRFYLARFTEKLSNRAAVLSQIFVENGCARFRGSAVISRNEFPMYFTERKERKKKEKEVYTSIASETTAV